jgi:hypothetical protein
MGPRRRGGPHLTSDVIYELEGGGREGEEAGAQSRGSENRRIVFFLSVLLGYIVLEGHEKAL